MLSIIPFPMILLVPLRHVAHVDYVTLLSVTLKMKVFWNSQAAIPSWRRSRHQVEVSLEAKYCKQCVRNHNPNLGSFAATHSLLGTRIHTELKAVSVVEINNNINIILVWHLKNTISFCSFSANERKAVCSYCICLGLWLVYMRM